MSEDYEIEDGFQPYVISYLLKCIGSLTPCVFVFIKNISLNYIVFIFKINGKSDIL